MVSFMCDTLVLEKSTEVRVTGKKRTVQILSLISYDFCCFCYLSAIQKRRNPDVGSIEVSNFLDNRLVRSLI